MSVRINKYLAERGVCSRRQADALIDAGKVMINGKRAEKGLKITGEEEILVRNKRLIPQKSEHQYIAFHKPVGIMTSVDPKGRDTIATFLHLTHRLFPVGRLDVASSGLLLLTNDGELSETITHPRGNHEKEYDVTVNHPITDTQLNELKKGMIILGSNTKPAKVVRKDANRFLIILTEGRNRQIRRMCKKLNLEVIKLIRIRVMNIKLGSLPVGKTRPLTNHEITTLKRLVGMQSIS